jgi:hypothetical protein
VQVVVRSRIGSLVLAVLGLVYFVSAVATLGYYIFENWGANGLTDYALQAALLAAATGGVLFFRIGSDNLKHPGAAVQRQTADGRSSAPMSAHPAS